MKRIGNSKEPTIQRMLNMTSNLKSKFNSHCAIDLSVNTYDHSDKSSYHFYLYVAHRGGDTIDSWAGVLRRYKELMNE